MRETRILMGMPVTVEVLDPKVTPADIEKVYAYYGYVDDTFSTYKESSEISKINAGLLTEDQWSVDMRHVMRQSELTRQETNGYFDIAHDGRLDPSGYVKGWAIQQAADMLADMGFADYYLEIAGDLQVSGNNKEGRPWIIGIRNPFDHGQIVKRVALSNQGAATSGTSARGQHIYNPHAAGEIRDILSLTVVGPRIVDADRYATAAFAMGRAGIEFIAGLDGFEGYMIDSTGTATFTPGFTRYVLP